MKIGRAVYGSYTERSKEEIRLTQVALSERGLRKLIQKDFKRIGEERDAALEWGADLEEDFLMLLGALKSEAPTKAYPNKSYGGSI